MKLKVGHWSVERKCQMGVVIQDGMSSDWWGAQQRLSCTMTVSYNAEYVERGCRKGVCRLCREEVEKKYRVGLSKEGWS